MNDAKCLSMIPSLPHNGIQCQRMCSVDVRVNDHPYTQHCITIDVVEAIWPIRNLMGQTPIASLALTLDDAGSLIGALCEAIHTGDSVMHMLSRYVRPASETPALQPTAANVERLADAASVADIASEFAIRPEWAADICRAVDLLHGVAMAAEAEYGYQVYDHSDEVSK